MARVAPRNKVRAGDRVRFEFETERLEFFDYDTGVAIND